MFAPVLLAAQSENESRLFTMLICLLGSLVVCAAAVRSIRGIRGTGPQGLPAQRLWLVRASTSEALPLATNVRIGTAGDGSQFRVLGDPDLLVDVVVGVDGPIAVAAHPGSMRLNGRAVDGPVALARGDELTIGDTMFEVSARAPR